MSVWSKNDDGCMCGCCFIIEVINCLVIFVFDLFGVGIGVEQFVEFGMIVGVYYEDLVVVEGIFVDYFWFVGECFVDCYDFVGDWCIDV